MNAKNRIKDEFKQNMPEFIILHLDRKVIRYEHGGETDEHLAIVASFPCANQRRHFLAASCIPDGTESSMRDALLNILSVGNSS